MEPTSWVLFFTEVPLVLLAVLTYNQWTMRDAFIAYTASIILLILSNSINLIPSIILVVISFYRLHTLFHFPFFHLSQTPKGPVNPTPSE